MKRIILLSTQCGDWEALYVDGALVTEGHEIDRWELLEMSEKYGFKSSDISRQELEDEDEEDVTNSGNMPTHISKLKGAYN